MLHSYTRLTILAAGLALSLVAGCLKGPESGSANSPMAAAALAPAERKKTSTSGAASARQTCAECHEEETQKLANFEHKTISCETCHGPGQAHESDPAVKFSKLTDEDCMRCHKLTEGAPDLPRQIARDAHFQGDQCIDCHKAHQPREMR
jgi:hypothetical protein